MKPNFAIGDKVGRLTILGPVKKLGPKQYFWPTKCECGNEKLVRTHAIGRCTFSCGCLQKERVAARARELRRTHGKSKTPTYVSWVSMIRRCYNPNDGEYKRYGERGIRVCERWRTFINFYADMGERPSLAYSLDRPNPNGNYDPQNCRWAPRQDEHKNRRPSREWRMTVNNPLYRRYMTAVGLLSLPS